MKTLESWADYWEQSCDRKDDVIKQFDHVITRLTQQKDEFIERGFAGPDIKAVARLIELIGAHRAVAGAIRIVRSACADNRTVKDNVTEKFLKE